MEQANLLSIPQWLQLRMSRRIAFVLLTLVVSVLSSQPSCDDKHIVCKPCPKGCDANVRAALLGLPWWRAGCTVGCCASR
jgi:hypothetical protein